MGRVNVWLRHWHFGEESQKPLQEADEARERPAVDHLHLDPDLPAVHRDQRYHVLRPRPVPDHGVLERRSPPLCGHHRHRLRAQHLRLQHRCRQVRQEEAPPAGLCPDVHLLGRIWSDPAAPSEERGHYGAKYDAENVKNRERKRERESLAM